MVAAWPVPTKTLVAEGVYRFSTASHGDVGLDGGFQAFPVSHPFPWEPLPGGSRLRT